MTRRSGASQPEMASRVRVDAVLLDLDGVLYVEDEPVPGARETVSAFRAARLAVRFVTNTTVLPRRRILERLQRLGFAAAPEELATPAALAVRVCLDRGHDRVALVMNDEVREDFAELHEVDHDAQAVIVGDLGPAFGYAPLNRAFRLLMDGAELIALQKNRFWLTRRRPLARRRPVRRRAGVRQRARCRRRREALAGVLRDGPHHAQRAAGASGDGG